jgi:hypothetical protein
VHVVIAKPVSTFARHALAKRGPDMHTRNGVRSAVKFARVASPRMRAFEAAALLATLFWIAACAWAADADAPVGSPSPGARMERGGTDLPSGPAMREDDPAMSDERTPDSGKADPPLLPRGCPYRGRTLELMV